MSPLETFIRKSHRPEINGGKLDKKYKSKFILELNDLTKLSIKMINTIAFGPRKDRVLLNLEHAISESDEILVFYYEDLHKKWSFIQTQIDSYFVYQKNEKEQYRIYPKNLYIRGCQVERDDPYWIWLGEFYNFVDSWNGRVICAPKKQNNNESKLYQLNTSLRAASQKCENVTIGKSYVLKGKNLEKALCQTSSYIVKSLSGIRSKVVDEQEFLTWNTASINHLPVLFQEKVQGHDLRVHVVNGMVYGKLSLEKEQVDYRYDAHFYSLIDFHEFSEELRQFCLAVTELEDNSFLGIDFIKKNENYVVLEANPSPGWSAYHEYKGVEKESFIENLLEELKRKEMKQQ